jgi:hypothetical protein
MIHHWPDQAADERYVIVLVWVDFGESHRDASPRRTVVVP